LLWTTAAILFVSSGWIWPHRYRIPYRCFVLLESVTAANKRYNFRPVESIVRWYSQIQTDILYYTPYKSALIIKQIIVYIIYIPILYTHALYRYAYYILMQLYIIYCAPIMFKLCMCAYISNKCGNHDYYREELECYTLSVYCFRLFLYLKR